MFSLREGGSHRIAVLRPFPAVLLVLAFLFFILRAGVPAVAEEMRVRAGTLKGGTLSWELFAMKSLGIDREWGFALERVDFAGKAAGEIAFLGGSVDVIVDDLFWVARQRARGIDITGIHPYTNNSGAVMVRDGSPIESLRDLKGKKIGIPNLAGKGWLALRLACMNEAGFDPLTESRVITSAPTLLSAFLKRGKLDAIIQFWPHIPALLAKGGFRELVRISDLVKDMVGTYDVSFSAYVVRRRFIDEHPETVRALVKAICEVREHMKENDEIWDEIWEHVGWKGRPYLIPLRERWRSGVPEPWTEESAKSLEKLFRGIARVGGDDLLGTQEMPEGTYSLIFDRGGS